MHCQNQDKKMKHLPTPCDCMILRNKKEIAAGTGPWYPTKYSYIPTRTLDLCLNSYQKKKNEKKLMP